MRLRDKAIVITGAARGFGRECALLFAREGARLTLLDVDADGAARTAAEVETDGGTAIGLGGDVSVLADHERAVGTTVDRYGTLDVYFNNAGVAPPGLRKIPWTDLTEQDLRRHLEINLLGAAFAAQAAARQLVQQETGGALLFTSSAASLLAVPGGAIYAAGKAGLNGLVRGLAVDLGRHRIRANAIAPLYGLNAAFSFADAPPNQSSYEAFGWDPAAAPMPLKRPEPPSMWDSAMAALFLASDEARWMSGVCLPTADGGTLSNINLGL